MINTKLISVLYKNYAPKESRFLPIFVLLLAYKLYFYTSYVN